MSRFFSQRISGIKPYVPGEQPQDKHYIKLNTNESPYPPSPNVKAVLTSGEIDKLKLYPGPCCEGLINQIAEFYNLHPDQVFVGNGSDEALAFSFIAFFDRGDKVYFPDITYGFYKVYSELFGIDYTQIPLDNNYKINVSDYFNLDGNIFIANPNAPTGYLLSLNEIEQILLHNKNNLVVVDEAYIDFGGESSVKLLDKYDNLLVVQTFSKSRSLAGARVGFALAGKQIIEDLNKVKFSFNPYNINRLSILAATQAMKDDDYFNQCTKSIIKTRDYTKRELDKLGFFVLESEANFLFAKSGKISGEDLYLRLKQKGILIRHFNQDRITDFVRITIGTDDQMNKFIELVKEVGG